MFNGFSWKLEDFHVASWFQFSDIAPVSALLRISSFTTFVFLQTPIKGPVALYDPAAQEEYDDYGGGPYGGGPPMGMRGAGGMRGGMRGGRGGPGGRGGYGGGPGFNRGRGRGLLPDDGVFVPQMVS